MFFFFQEIWHLLKYKYVYNILKSALECNKSAQNERQSVVHKASWNDTTFVLNALLSLCNDASTTWLHCRLYMWHQDLCRQIGCIYVCLSKIDFSIPLNAFNYIHTKSIKKVTYHKQKKENALIWCNKKWIRFSCPKYIDTLFSWKIKVKKITIK